MSQPGEKKASGGDAPSATPPQIAEAGGGGALAAALIKAGVFGVREVLAYCSYVFKVPVLFCFLAMAGAIAAVIDDLYLHSTAAVAQVLPGHSLDIHLDTGGFIKLYWLLATLLYAVNVVLRLAHVRVAHRTRRAQLRTATIVATIGWGFVLCNLPFVRVAPGTSRLELAELFVCFYVVTVVAFAAALDFARLGDLVNEAGNKLVHTIHANPAPVDLSAGANGERPGSDSA